MKTGEFPTFLKCFLPIYKSIVKNGLCEGPVTSLTIYSILRLKSIKKENPNVIFITGDLIDAEHYSEENLKYKNNEVNIPEKLTVDFCKELTQIAKVYFVYGNHELMLLDDPEENIFKKELESFGITILNNKIEYIKLGEEEYRLVGVQDPATLYKDKKYAFIGESNKERAESILHDLFLDQRDVFTIVLSHRPEYFDLYKEYDIDIKLPEDNRNVIFGVVKNCYNEPIEDAVVKLVEIVYDCGKKERDHAVWRGLFPVIMIMLFIDPIE